MNEYDGGGYLRPGPNVVVNISRWPEALQRFTTDEGKETPPSDE